jgi:hypothetical protein
MAIPVIDVVDGLDVPGIDACGVTTNAVVKVVLLWNDQAAPRYKTEAISVDLFALEFEGRVGRISPAAECDGPLPEPTLVKEREHIFKESLPVLFCDVIRMKHPFILPQLVLEWKRCVQGHHPRA